MCLAEFWARFATRESLLILANDGMPGVAANVRTISSVPIEIVRDADLAATRMWIANWERILPTLAAHYGRLPQPLLTAVRRFVSAPRQLSCIERENTTGDPTAVRAAVFALLHRGELVAPKLHTEPLSWLTVFEPVGIKS